MTLARATALVLLMLSACGDGSASLAEGEPKPDQAAEVPQDEVVVSDNHPVVEVPAELDTISPLVDDGKVVVGDDNRQPIGDTSAAPFSSVVLLWTTFPKSAPGTVGSCTGTLISEDAVLTAAHCVHNRRDLGGRAVSVRVLPGAFATGKVQSTLRGIGESGVRDIYVPDEYDDPDGYTYELMQYDYAVLRLNKPLGKLAGYRDYGTLLDPAGRYAQMLAFHGDLCPTKASSCAGRPSSMYQSEDRVRRVVGTIANHYIDMTPGASGAGITSDGSDFRQIFAINVAERKSPRYNMALLLTTTIVADIRKHVQMP